MKKSWLILLLLLLHTVLLFAQPGTPLKYNTLGMDMELLSYGGSLGGFYSYHPNEAISLDLELDWSLVQNSDTFTYYDIYGQPYSINNRNLSLVKITPGMTWLPFIETMHPSFQVGTFFSAGPLWALNTADDESFLKRWKDVDIDLTPIFRGGLHIRILTGQGTSYTFRIGYDYASFDRVIDSRQTYKGLFFQAGMEFLHR